MSNRGYGRECKPHTLGDVNWMGFSNRGMHICPLSNHYLGLAELEKERS